MRRSHLFILAALFYMGLIYFLSSQPGDAGLGITAPFDKLAHGVEYAVLGFLLCGGMKDFKWGWVFALCLAVFFGFTDEFHQSFVPGREATGADAAADAIGSAVGVWLALVHAVRR